MQEPGAVTAFTEAFVVEDPVIVAAREASAELGVDPVSPATGAALALAAAAHRQGSFIELGTGVGVSGLWLLTGAPEATLTTIDVDLDQHQEARRLFAAAGHPVRRTRFITSRAADVLPRMNESSYDLVLVDADVEPVLAYVEAALGLVRPGGSVLVTNVLQGGRVAMANRRDKATTAYRELLKSVRDRDGVLGGVSTVGDGLLHLVRR